jgi:hypothetical protein
MPHLRRKGKVGLAFFKQLRMQRHGEAIESFNVDALPAFFKRLKEC